MVILCASRVQSSILWSIKGRCLQQLYVLTVVDLRYDTQVLLPGDFWILIIHFEAFAVKWSNIVVQHFLA